MKFSERLKQLRCERGISQAKLAKAIGVSQSSINYWEKGERTPSAEAVVKIADYFQEDLNTLLDTSIRDIRKKEKRLRSTLDNKNLSDQERELLHNLLRQLFALENDFDVKKWQIEMNDPDLIKEREKNIVDFILSAKEKGLVENFRSLNETGQEKAMEQVELLTKIPEYQKSND